MLFLVISTPAPVKPSTVASTRRRYWRWIAPLEAAGTVRSVHARPGRGAVVLFDVDSHEHLHRLVTEWTEMIPATFEILPLIDASQARAHLAPAKAARKG
jgi:muconolactone delta-isomerase